MTVHDMTLSIPLNKAFPLPKDDVLPADLRDLLRALDVQAAAPPHRQNTGPPKT